MITPVSKIIDGNEYVFTPMGAKQARNALVRLLKLVGPGWADGLDGLKGRISTDVLDAGDASPEALLKLVEPLAGTVAGLIRGFLAKLTAEEYESITNDFLERVQVIDKSGNKVRLTSAQREDRFAVSLLAELKVLIWCFESQYADFFGYLGMAKSFTAAAREKIESSFVSPKESIGGSSGLRPPNVTAVD